MSKSVVAYRAVCYDMSSGELLEEWHHETYKKAHLQTLEWDTYYDFPRQEYWVERSLDGGTSWARYDANEFACGRPAWTYDKL